LSFVSKVIRETDVNRGEQICRYNALYIANLDNIKMDHREIGWDGMDWVDVALDRDQWMALVNTVMNLRVP
jgi:hypothetical protein